MVAILTSPAPVRSPRPAGRDSAGVWPEAPSTQSILHSNYFNVSKWAASQNNKLPPIGRLGVGGKLDSRHDEVRIGGLVSVLNARPVSQHALRRYPRSLQERHEVPPSSVRHMQPSQRDLHQDVSNIPHTNSEERLQQVPQTIISIQSLLNPTSSQLLVPKAGSHLSLTTCTSKSGTSGQTSGLVSASFIRARAFSLSQTASDSVPGIPLGLMTPVGGPPPGCDVSSTAFPYHKNSSRPESSLTKRLRAMSVGHIPSLESDGWQSLNGPLSAERQYQDTTPEGTKTQYSHPHSLIDTPIEPTMAILGNGRIHSQVPIASPGGQVPLPTVPLSYTPGLTKPPMVQSQVSCSPNVQASLPFPSQGTSSKSTSSCSEALPSSETGGSLFGVEGQQALLKLPASEAPIPVQIDFSRASKKSDAKRQRNAVASVRYRKRKKIIQEENTKQLQELRDESRLMEIRIEESIQRRGLYHKDRKRLRKLVAHTPSTSGLSAVTPSPIVLLSNSYAETLSGPAGSMVSRDILSNERPAQRRRTDGHPEYSLPPYRSPANRDLNTFHRPGAKEQDLRAGH